MSKWRTTHGQTHVFIMIPNLPVKVGASDHLLTGLLVNTTAAIKLQRKILGEQYSEHSSHPANFTFLAAALTLCHTEGRTTFKFPLVRGAFTV